MARTPAGGDPGQIGRDPAAFGAFYRNHVEAVQRFVTRRVADPHRAADLTADIFLAAIESADTYSGSGAGEVGWLFGIARNVVAGDRRKSYREGLLVGRIAGRRLLDVDDIHRLEERIDAGARARDLYEAMSCLSEGERAVLELVAIDGLAVSAAARTLGIRPVTARVRLHRARARLRDRLAAEPSGTTTALPILSEESR